MGGNEPSVNPQSDERCHLRLKLFACRHALLREDSSQAQETRRSPQARPGNGRSVFKPNPLPQETIQMLLKDKVVVITRRRPQWPGLATPG